MYTQCPHCLSVHAIDATQLSMGRGQLVCGVCEEPFNALERLAETPLEVAASARRTAPVEPPRVMPRGLSAELSGKASKQAEQVPQFLGRVRPGRARPSGRWWLLSLVLGLVLGSQIVLAQRAELSQDPALRPWLQSLCRLAKCDLPLFHAPAQIVLLNRDVSPHPSVPDALLITASFRNESPWPQAWPVLELSMSDLDGRLVALRRFGAAEYMGQTPPQTELAPGQPVLVELEIRDPGNQAIAFEFGFL